MQWERVGDEGWPRIGAGGRRLTFIRYLFRAHAVNGASLLLCCRQTGIHAFSRVMDGQWICVSACALIEAV